MPFRLHWPYYAAPIVLLSVLVLALTPNGGKRLPFYYLPDGSILPIEPKPDFSKIKKINGENPIRSPLHFDASTKNAEIISELGIHHIALVQNDRFRLILDFKMLFAFALANLLAAFWLFFVAQDLLLGFLCFVQTLFALSFYGVLVSEHLYYSWILSGILMPPALLNMGLRITGKEIRPFLLLSELFLALFLFLVAIVGGEHIETIRNLGLLNFFLFFSALLLVLLFQFQSLLQRTEDEVARYKKRFMLLGTLVGIALPTILVFLNWQWSFASPSLSWMLLPGLFFPAALIYNTYRLHFVRFQLILTRSLLAGILTVLLIGLYGGTLLLHSMLLPESSGHSGWIVNTIFVLVLAFLLDPLRRKLASTIEKRFFRLDSRLVESLKILTSLVARHSRIQPAVNHFLQELKNTLHLEKASFLFASKTFPELRLRPEDMLRISETSPIWRHLKAEQLRVAAYLSYATGSRGELFRFLYKNNFLLAIGIDKGSYSRRTAARFISSRFLSFGNFFRERLKKKAASQNESIHAALLVGYKKDRSKLRLNEIRYLQEAVKLASLLIYNYAILIQELEKRKRKRELQLAGIVQRSLPGPSQGALEHFDIAYINKPAVSVSGDYLDILSLSSTRFALLLGDVSGHGLGTGYIASASRSIIRSHLFAGWPLSDTINSLNTFLVERYRGGEFITLFAGVIDVETGRLEYINAAHPGPLIRRINGEFQELISTQRLVGVLPTLYHTEEVYLHPQERLFLFSDGVTETFNQEDVAYGDKRLLEFLQQNGDLPVGEIVSKVEKELLDFREDSALTDDTTFIAIEFRPQLGLVESLFRLLGLARNRGS